LCKGCRGGVRNAPPHCVLLCPVLVSSRDHVGELSSDARLVVQSQRTTGGWIARQLARHPRPTSFRRLPGMGIERKYLLYFLRLFYSTGTDIGRNEIEMGPDLQNILRQSYNCLTTMPKLRSTYYGRLIYKIYYEGREAFLRYDLLAKL